MISLAKLYRRKTNSSRPCCYKTVICTYVVAMLLNRHLKDNEETSRHPAQSMVDNHWLCKCKGSDLQSCPEMLMLLML